MPSSLNMTNRVGIIAAGVVGAVFVAVVILCGPGPSLRMLFPLPIALAGGHVVVAAANWSAWVEADERPDFAWWTLTLTALWLTGVVSILGVIFVYPGFLPPHWLIGLTVMPPFLLGSWSWALRGDRGVAVLRPWRDRLVLYPLILLGGMTVLTNWPFHLAFRLARPTLDRFADRVEAGKLKPYETSTRAGLFSVRVIQPRESVGRDIVSLEVADHAGRFPLWEAPYFCRPVKVPGHPPMPAPGWAEEVPLGDGWYYTNFPGYGR